MSRARLLATTLEVAVHHDGDNPVFGETATRVRIEDEGAGPFVTLRQDYPNMEPGKVMLDPQELEAVASVARRMLERYRE